MALGAPATVAEVVCSKRVRFIAATTAFSLLLVFGLYHSEGLNILRSGTERNPISSSHHAPPAETSTDWSRFAYAQYVTDSMYLCNAVMAFSKLRQLGSKADRVMMYPSYMFPRPNADAAEARSNDARLIVKARDEYLVKLSPVVIQHKEGQDPTWAASFTKLLAFNQTQYERVLSMDSDSIILQPMDELFLLPPAPVAMPRAYWQWPESELLSSQLVLIQPSEFEFARVKAKIDAAGPSDYDMDILNDLYRESALVLPHRPYNLVTGEFKDKPDHAAYLGNKEEEWDPVAVYNEAKFLHFSDHPIPKPWLSTPEDERARTEPSCVKIGEEEDCAARDLWNGFYSEFREARKSVCDSVKMKNPWQPRR